MLAIALAVFLIPDGGSHEPRAGGHRADEDAFRNLDLEARVDPVKGTIKLPLDHFSPDFHEMHEIDLAFDLLMRKCMSTSGFQYDFVDMRNVPEPMSRRYGIWVASEAERYGYSIPPPDAATEAALRLNGEAHPAEYQELFQACSQARDFRPLQVEISSARSIQTYEQALEAPEAASALAGWRSCLAGRGVTANQPGPLRWIPVGVDPGSSNATSIATIDVECKSTVGLVSRLAAVEAAIQRRRIKANEEMCLRQWESKSEALRYARSVTGNP